MVFWLVVAAAVALTLLAIGLVLVLMRWILMARVIAQKANEPSHLDQNNYSLDQAREVRPE